MDKLIVFILLVILAFSTYNMSAKDSLVVLDGYSDQINESANDLRNTVKNKDYITYQMLKSYYDKGVVVEVSLSGSEDGIYAIATSLDEQTATVALPVSFTKQTRFIFTGARFKTALDGTIVRIYVKREQRN